MVDSVRNLDLAKKHRGRVTQNLAFFYVFFFSFSTTGRPKGA